MNFSNVNTGTSIIAKQGYDIAITAAISGFTANGINIALNGYTDSVMATENLLDITTENG